MGYEDFIASNHRENGFGMFTEEANDKVRIMLEEIAYVIFTDLGLDRNKFADYVKKTMKKLYNSDSKNLMELFDTEVEETIVLYLNNALKSAGHRFKLTRWNIQQ